MVNRIDLKLTVIRPLHRYDTAHYQQLKDPLKSDTFIWKFREVSWCLNFEPWAEVDPGTNTPCLKYDT